MYPLQCYAGFSMPVKAGKFSITGFSVAAEDSAIPIELVIVDDAQIKPDDNFGRLLETPDNHKNVITHRKGIITYGVQIDAFTFQEPVKTRYGISVYTSNVLANSLCVFVK